MRSLAVSILLLISLLYSSISYAGGYELLEQSGESVGLAYAGSATGYGDASEVFFNPGALPELDGTHVSAGTILYMPRTKFTNEGSSYIEELGGGKISGSPSQEIEEKSLVPNIYFSHQVDSKIVFGLGVNSPFGLATKFDSDWIGRYHSIESSLTTLNVNPALGFRVSETLSLGILSQLMYAKATLKDAVDFGAIGISALGPELGLASGLTPGSSDGLVEISGDDWGFGYGVGALYQPTSALKLGFAFKAPIRLSLSGDADFSVPDSAQILTSEGNFQDTAVSADLTLPETVSIGAAYRVSSRTTLLLDATWVRWTRYDNLVIDFVGSQPDSIERDSWDNSVRLATGVKFEVSDELKLKLGAAWDQSPLRDEKFLTPRIPDADHLWLSCGTTYELYSGLNLGINYSHVFSEVVHSDSIVNETGASLIGKWESSADIFALELNYAI